MQRFRHVLATSGHQRCLFHFTDRRNIPSIAKHGLLSQLELGRRHIPVEAPGGSEGSWKADRRLGLDRYVHLCLLNEHPMEYVARQDGRIGETMFIRVLPAVLDRPGIVFCTEVSIKAGASVRPLEEVDEYIDLEAVYSRTDWKDPEVQKRRNLMKKFEILIPDHIPVELLRKPLSG